MKISLAILFICCKFVVAQSPKKPFDEAQAKKDLVGIWHLDSLVDKATDEKQSDLGPRAKLRPDRTIVLYFQQQFNSNGDEVTNDEYKSDGTHITTTINQYSLAKEPVGKYVSTSKFKIKGNSIVDFGTTKAELTMYPNGSSSKILKLNSTNLVLYVDGFHPTKQYYTKVK